MPRPRPVIHLIPQAHLDPVWLWPWRDGAAEALTTLQSAVDRAAEYPGFTFTRSTASLYRWVQEQDPRLFAAIRRLVRAGRWEMIGGWIEQPDCNLPSAESFVRQALLGRAWLRRHLGATTTIGYNVDSFGHHGGLPQLLRLTGYRHYVFMRPELHEAPEIPNLFWWESDDGSRVLTQRVPVNYAQPPDITPDGLEQLVRKDWKQHVSPGLDHGIFWFGIGNHGGGPTRELIQRILELQRDETLPELRFSSVAAYFAAIEPTLPRRLPVVRGDLLHKFRGCYAATGAVKYDHRRCESALRVTEQVLTLAPAAPAPDATTRTVLRDLVWQLGDLQFHDILAGTCVHSVQEENRDRFGTVADGLQRLRVRAVHRLAREVDTRDATTSVLFAHNPLPWPRRALVRVDAFRDPHRRGPFTHLAPADGPAVPLQWLEADAAFGPWLMPWGKLTVPVDLPAGGYRSIDLAVRAEEPVKPLPPATRFAAKVPGLAGWRVAGREWLRGPLQPVVMDDPWDTWGHDMTGYGDTAQTWRLVAQRTLADGPHVRVHRQHLRWRRSSLWLDVIERPAEDVIELVVRLDWQQRRQLCALELPAALLRPELVVKTAGGVAVRPTDGTAQPGQEWCALSGDRARGAGRGTVLVASDAAYSYAGHGSTLRLVIARGTPYAEHKPVRVPADRPEPFTDQGWQTRRFWLRAAAGDWCDLAPDRFATECLVPPEVMLDNAHPGDRPRTAAGWAVGPAHVSLLAAKPAEDGRGTVLRVQEMSGRRTSATITPPDGSAHRFPLKPWQIVTWLHDAAGRFQAVDGLEQPAR